MRKNEYNCPWCGAKFSDVRKLDVHARKHYCVKELEAIAVAQ